MAPQGGGPWESAFLRKDPESPFRWSPPKTSWPPGSPPLPREVRLQATGPSGPSLAALDSAASPMQGQPSL